MVQLIGAVIVTVVVVAFAMANAHHVELSCVLGSPFQVRLISLLAVAYAAGLVTGWLHRIFKDAARQAEQRRIQRMVKRAALQEVDAE